jgi:hypothetical protein
MAELSDDSNEYPANSVFHPDNVAAGTLVALLRCYDMLGVIARAVDPETYGRVVTLHDVGGLLSGVPYLSTLPEDSDDGAAEDREL